MTLGVAEPPDAVGIGGLAERRLHLDPAHALEPIHLVEPAAADHAHRDLPVIAARRLYLSRVHLLEHAQRFGPLPRR